MKALVFALMVVWFAFGALMLVGSIGKQRKPVEPAVAVVGLLLYALQIAGVWYLARGSQ